MALASLCANTSHILGDFLECVALIVDHKSRPESTEEALWVAQQLLKHGELHLGFTTAVTWYLTVYPLKLA